MDINPFSLNEYQAAVEGTGRRVRRAKSSFTAQCLKHAERNPSMQVFEDGWCQCYAGCGRFHISHFFPEFIDPNFKSQPKQPTMSQPIAPISNEQKKPQYKPYELFDVWSALAPIPREHTFKGIPLDVLDSLGWRWTDSTHGMGAGYFIPYFNHDKTKIPFAQVRHLTGERRFTMLPEAEMTAYGKWNLHPGEKLFLVEGCSDAAVLDYAAVPWIAIPSASGTVMLTNLAKFCLKNSIGLVYAGDNDEAGDKLKAAIDEVAPYRVHQPPKQYKDWGDFLEAEGIEKVAEYAWAELREPEMPPMMALATDVFGGEGGQKPMF